MVEATTIVVVAVITRATSEVATSPPRSLIAVTHRTINHVKEVAVTITRAGKTRMTTLSSHTTIAVETTTTETVTITIVTAKAIITNLITKTAIIEVAATEIKVKAEVAIKVAVVNVETTEAILVVELRMQAVVEMTTTIVVLGITERVDLTVVVTTGTSTRAATAAMNAMYLAKVGLVAAIKVAETIITITTMIETTTVREAILPMIAQVVNNKIVDLNAVILAKDIVADTEEVIKVVETMVIVVATITIMDITTTIRPTGNSTVGVTIANLPMAVAITREANNSIECKDVIRGVVAVHQISYRIRLTLPLMNRKASENYEQNATYD